VELLLFLILGKGKTVSALEGAFDWKEKNWEWNEWEKNGDVEERGAERKTETGTVFGREGNESGCCSPSCCIQQGEFQSFYTVIYLKRIINYFS